MNLFQGDTQMYSEPFQNLRWNFLQKTVNGLKPVSV